MAVHPSHSWIPATAQARFPVRDESCRTYQCPPSLRKIRPGLENELRPLLESLNEMDGPPFSEGSAPESEEGEDLPERLSGHKILGDIGVGGMGRVLLGYDERLNRKVAIKILGRRYRAEETVK